jgi:hypothetical protein
VRNRDRKKSKRERTGRRGGLARTPAKKAAARRRFQAATTKAFIRSLIETPDLLDIPELQAPLDDLTALLVMRKVTQLGLAPAAPAEIQR